MLRLTTLSCAAFGASALASPTAALAQPQAAALMVGELIVTAQRRAEAMEDVPIAMTALTGRDLLDRGLDGGRDLLHATPNVSFSKRPFTDYNFQIRGVGSKVVGASGDPGVGVHLNNAPMITNRLFEAEFYDMERVEVLRGPQGTLYGRNATGGVVNLITAKPELDRIYGAARIEAGDYDTRKVRGMLNLPLGETLALRVAGTALKRGGFGRNLTLGAPIDDRDLYAWRATLDFVPAPGLRLRGYYEHFNEDDRRVRTGKQLCAKDEGPLSVGGVPVLNPVARGLQSQGCRNVSLYDPAALGTVNTQPTLSGAFALLNGLATRDAYAGKMQHPDLRSVESAINPAYRAQEDVFQFGLDIDLAEHLTLSLLSAHAEDRFFSRQDYNRVTSVTAFTVPTALAPLFANGVFVDPQVGAANTPRALDISQARSNATSHELRLASDTGGAVDFHLGGLYLDYAVDQDYFIMSNVLTLSALSNTPIPGRYVDPSALPTGEGHNYYLTRTPYRLRSYAGFGEIYWRPTSRLKVTVGGRYNHDLKRQRMLPAQLAVPGRGFPTIGTRVAEARFQESTGRLGLDWKPDLAFTEQALVYAFASRGYKPGGFNPPCSAGVNCPAASYAPEFVNALEIGTKSVLAGGRLHINLSAFVYDYDDYQVSKTVNRTTVSENIDAAIRGFEAETVWNPTHALSLNASLGLLHTKIRGGSSIDTLNRTQGDPALALLSGALVGGNCVVPTRQLAAFNAAANANPGAASLLLTACGGALRTGSSTATGNPLAPLGVFLDPAEGVAVNLKGHRLPNAPRATLSIGVQYDLSLPGGWGGMVRADYWRQTASFARIYNSVADRMKGYENLNLLARITRADLGLTVEAYVRNLTNESAITDISLTDDSSGLFRNIFLTDPRIAGVAVSKTF